LSLYKCGIVPPSRRHPPIIDAAAMRGRSHAIASIKQWYGHLAIQATTAALAVAYRSFSFAPRIAY
jgi:hypothetical protein